MFCAVTSCTERLLQPETPLQAPVLKSSMMPLRASMLVVPDGDIGDGPRAGLSPSISRWSIVTLFDCTRKTLEAPEQSEPPPAPPQSGFETAGSTKVVG